jgi:hypothetical protein
MAEMGTKGGRHPLVVHYMYMFVMKIMKQHKKIVIITVIAILAAAAIAFATFHKKNAENEVSVQKVDTSIGQYPDRANVLPAVVTPVAATFKRSLGGNVHFGICVAAKRLDRSQWRQGYLRSQPKE